VSRKNKQLLATQKCHSYCLGLDLAPNLGPNDIFEINMNRGTCFGNLKIDYENSLFRLAYNPPLDLNALNFWVKFHNLVMRKGPCGLQKFFGEKICVYVATLLAIFF
jgi:hypothetical protein